MVSDKQLSKFKLEIYQCNDGSWRVISENYMEDWGDYKLRNLTAEQVIKEIKKMISSCKLKEYSNEEEAND